MNRFLTLCFLSILICSCSNEKTNVSELVVFSEDNNLEFIEVIRPIEGMILWDNKRDTIRTIEKGSFKCSLDINNPEVIRLVIGDKRVKMIIEPNHSYEIKALDSAIVFKGDNAKGNDLLNTLHGAYNNNLDDIFKYENDSTAVSVKQKIDFDKKNEISQIDALLTQNLIDKAFYNLFKNEIDYRYAEKIVNIVLSKSYSGDLINAGLEKLLNETIETHPVSTKNLPSNWKEYAEFVIIEKNQYEQKKKV
ncbi:hypothetical protein [Mangrovimonas futianensis]|uniref:hypothetical protein n=1 Tax=Mangrovimonas futianensis TaxID=2895523 RepID=UPI001E3CAF21|nr:hypothetical protein [Mangrovimonas futianensis]MCF1422823.1 hypothetical protein [Mangrovimonas futianensis]